jgi:nucleotide-binding universal stress UspA family protein
MDISPMMCVSRASARALGQREKGSMGVSPLPWRLTGVSPGNRRNLNPLLWCSEQTSRRVAGVASSQRGARHQGLRAKRLEQERWHAENALLALWIEVRSKHPNCDYYFASGSPREMIVRAAKGLSADLIVISTHDYHWLRHLFFGSDAEDILRHAPCPILIVHQHEHDFMAA